MTDTILFAEVPRFYAEVERARDPTSADRPVIVGGDPRKRGTVQSATQDALDRGVEVGMQTLVALDRCPRARLARTDMKRYREVSGRLRACLRAEVDSIEPVGLDAAYLTAPHAVSAGSRSTFGAHEAVRPDELAERLQSRVARELGLPLRVGIACVKYLARLAAEEAGSEGRLQVHPGEELDFLAPLPVGRLPGVGPKTVTALEELGVRGVGDLRRVDAARLEAALGNHGLRILEYARGEDHAQVRAARHPKSLSKEHTFSEGQLDLGVLWECLETLARSVEAALLREALLARRVAIKVRYADGDTTTRSRTLPGPISKGGDVYAAAAALLERTHAGSRAIQLLGITLGGLSAGTQPDPQLDLFPTPPAP